jgi:hypothetical protein
LIEGIIVRKHLTIAFASFLALAVVAAAQAATPDGTYKGTYTCSAGPGGVTLDITPRRSGKLAAVLRFYSLAGKTNVAPGSYRMSGRFVPATGEVVLFARSWIQQPPGYTLANIKGKLSADGKSISGRLTGDAGCKGIKVKRQG